MYNREDMDSMMNEEMMSEMADMYGDDPYDSYMGGMGGMPGGLVDSGNEDDGEDEEQPTSSRAQNNFEF